MSGLSLHGKEFIKDPSVHRPALLHNDFDFVRKNEGDGFENQKLYLIHFTKDFEIKLMDEKKAVRQ